MVVVGCGPLGRGCSGQFYTMPRYVLDLDKQVQLEVLLPNILVGTATVDMGGESSSSTLLQLQTIHNLRFLCKTWKLVLDKSTKYNALCLAEYNYMIWPNHTTTRFMSIKNNIVILFQENMNCFTKSRYVNTRISRRILQARLENLTLPELVRLREELKMFFYAVEVYGMIFYATPPYWTCPADRV